MTTNRFRGLCSLGLAGAAATLLLGGCGITLPNQAAQVGDESISTARVDDLADGVCGTWNALGSQTMMSLGRVRGDAAFGLAQRSLADQMAKDYGVAVSDSYHQIVQQAVSGLPDSVTQKQEDELVEVYLAKYYLDDISRSAAKVALEDAGVDNPGQAEIENRAKALRAEYEADHPVTFDPKFGLRYDDLDPVRGGDTSYAVSKLAQDGMKPDESPTVLQALPADQRCGGAA